ncbi:BOS complex subunit NOMO3-like isoform X2 [Tubulanus polymorphus]
MKLYTKQGSLKYQMECAPNNGYYMIPVYDKGEYVLKVEPPKGWKFEPESVELHIDGKSDRCSKGEDLNFHFIGFTVDGVVNSKGVSDGPAGVTVKLYRTDDNEIVQATKTETGGLFVFEKVLPGQYRIEASHPSWILEKSKVDLKVEKNNVNIKSGLVVHGYEVSGQVLSEGEPITGVNFLLLSDSVNAKDVKGCVTTPVKGYNVPSNMKLLCHAASSEDGKFNFKSLPCGSYSIVPMFKGEKITFDVIPAKLDFKIAHESINFDKPFQVAGFSVAGRVLDSKSGSGISGARVRVNGKDHTTTGADGSYTLENMKTGTYSIEIAADKIAFDDLNVKISPNTPQLPDIIASSFSLCGNVHIDRFPTGVSAIRERVLSLQYKNSKGDVITLGKVTTDVKGDYCTTVRPGVYTIKPVLSDTELRAGLLLNPTEQPVTISSKYVTNVNFKQFKAKISGNLKCIDNCGTKIQVALSGRSGDKKIAKISGSGKSLHFTFDDVMPGRYQVTVLEDTWCWKQKTQEVDVRNRDVSGVELVHSGYVVPYSISHDKVILHFDRQGKDSKSVSFAATKGSNSYCLEKPGIYKVTPESCHIFDEDSYTFDTSNPQMLSLVASRHQVDGRVVTPGIFRDIKIKIMSTLNAEKEIGPLEIFEEPPSKLGKDNKPYPDGPYVYRFVTIAKTGEKLTFTPSSKELLFYPPQAEMTVKGEACPGELVKLDGRRGLFINGKIQPPLAGVDIKIVSELRSEVMTTVSDAKGKYSVGPLHDDTKYFVTAKKDGYIMTEIDGKLGHFKAFKLGQIDVKVVDEDKKALGGVLLSLSGGSQYRSNNLTHENGSMVFVNLSPGQFFLRPMMKEYNFEPSSKMIEVKEGSTVSLEVTGKRVAYSCFGLVSSLNGEPEPGVMVEAVGQGETCSVYQEESKTEKDGSYRIRGLQPNCKYEIRLKAGESNEHIERAAPKSIHIQVEKSDKMNVNIIAFRRLNQLDLSGRIVGDQKNLPGLKVVLFREDNPDSPIHTLTMGVSPMFYLPTIPQDGKRYFVRLESGMSKQGYDYSLPEVSFTANTSFKHFVLHFTPKPKSTEQELNQGSFMILPVAGLVILLSYHYQKLLPFLHQAGVGISGIVSRAGASAMAPAPIPVLDDEFIEAEFGPKKKIRVRKT